MVFVNDCSLLVAFLAQIHPVPGKAARIQGHKTEFNAMLYFFADCAL